ncbi:MAG: hypothetical protein KDK78_05890, partial [Chlamydiia bacterium]|nr:hypothetical protein [Chlamydiia bacterium]
IDNFENYLEARAKTIKKFVDDTAQTVIREHLPDINPDESKMWVLFLEKGIVQQMIESNSRRHPNLVKRKR